MSKNLKNKIYKMNLILVVVQFYLQVVQRSRKKRKKLLLKNLNLWKKKQITKKMRQQKF